MEPVKVFQKGSRKVATEALIFLIKIGIFFFCFHQFCEVRVSEAPSLGQEAGAVWTWVDASHLLLK